MGKRGLTWGIVGVGLSLSLIGSTARIASAQGTVRVLTAPTGTPAPTGGQAATPRPTPADMPTALPTKSCPPGTQRVGEEDRNCSAFGDCCKPIGGSQH